MCVHVCIYVYVYICILTYLYQTPSHCQTKGKHETPMYHRQYLSKNYFLYKTKFFYRIFLKTLFSINSHFKWICLYIKCSHHLQSSLKFYNFFLCTYFKLSREFPFAPRSPICTMTCWWKNRTNIGFNPLCPN